VRVPLSPIANTDLANLTAYPTSSLAIHPLQSINPSKISPERAHRVYRASRKSRNSPSRRVLEDSWVVGVDEQLVKFVGGDSCRRGNAADLVTLNIYPDRVAALS